MRFVIVGGGVAGVSCALGLLRYDPTPSNEVILVTASKHVKTISNWHKVGQFTEQFEVTTSNSKLSDDPRLAIVNDMVASWNHETKVLITAGQREIHYDKLCIATGARPVCPWPDEKVLTIRDTETALTLQERLATVKNLAIVGNGGIATELVYELNNVNITWIMRDANVSSSFFPKEVEEFILPRLLHGRAKGFKNDGILKRDEYSASADLTPKNSLIPGAALGPDWCSAIKLITENDNIGHNVRIIANSEVFDVRFAEAEVSVHYADTKTKELNSVNCELLIWATGVVPNTEQWTKSCSQLGLGADGGISVNEVMQTTVDDVFACGDVCSLRKESDFWKQMRLWTQARQMGDLCSHSMISADDAREFNMCLELFAHCTTFFGFKVVFLGDYKPERQTAGTWRIVERVIEETQFVRCVVVNHRVVGVLLIGDTDLEETMENLILNRTDIECIEENFLDPSVEIDDYFD